MASGSPAARSRRRAPSALLPACALSVMAGLVVASALLSLRELALDLNPNADRVALADPWPFALVAVIGWLLLERVARELLGPASRMRVLHAPLLVVRLTLGACLVLAMAGPMAQVTLDQGGWLLGLR